LAVFTTTTKGDGRALELAWIATAIHAALFFALGVVRWRAHRALVDFGLFTQVVASAFSGFSSTFEGVSHWAFHFSPILYICAPFVLLTHSGLALTAIQSIAIALVIPPAYLIARRRTSAFRALAVAGVAAIYPALAGIDFTDFHENGFAPAATMWLLWALDGRRWAYAYAFLALTLAIKEDQALVMGFLGIVAIVAFRRENDRAGIRFATIAIVASITIFVVYFALIRPLADPLHHWQPTRFYAWRLRDVATVGFQTLPDRLGYLFLALAPLCFIPLRSRVMVLALPGLAECLLSREHAPYTMGQHYAAVWAPYVLAAFIVAISRLQSSRWIAGSAMLCLLTYLVANPLHPGYFLRVPDARDARLDSWLARLPAQARIGTQEEAYTHLGMDPNAQLGIAGEPEYVLLDREYPDSVWLAWTDPLLRRAVAQGRYRLEGREGKIEFYQRNSFLK
jgi:uncharacterized membrane protein